MTKKKIAPPLFTLRIELGNAEMSSPRDVAGVLEHLRQTLLEDTEYRGLDGGDVRYPNGSKVGEWTAKWPPNSRKK